MDTKNPGVIDNPFYSRVTVIIESKVPETEDDEWCPQKTTTEWTSKGPRGSERSALEC